MNIRIVHLRMNPKFLTIAALVCICAAPTLSTIELAIGGLTLSATATTALAAGLVGAKVLGVAVGAGLGSRGSSRGGYSSRGRSYGGRSYGGRSYGSRSYSRGRYGRDVSDNEVNEPELLFRSFEESDPAHCFRRYICDLATGELNENPSHQVIRNLFLKFDHSKSATFEYEVAATVGHKLKSIKQCEELYDCHLTGNQLDKLFD